MATTNDITGDLIKSRASNEAFSAGYDRIFGKKTKPEQSENEVKPSEVNDEQKRDPREL